MADIVFFRHWEAKYENLNVDSSKVFHSIEQYKKELSWVMDLKPESYEVITSYVRKLLEIIDIKKYKKIHIWSSPLARTIETTSIILEELQNNNINPQKIAIFNILEEVRWFNWQIHTTLCYWWCLNVNWKTINIDKQITNPRNLNFTDYFFEDEIHKIKDKISD